MPVALNLKNEKLVWNIAEGSTLLDDNLHLGTNSVLNGLYAKHSKENNTLILKLSNHHICKIKKWSQP